LSWTATYDVAPTVNRDLDLDHRSRWFDEDPETAGRSTFKVEGGVNVAVAVQVNVLRQRRRQPTSTSTSS
jgi:hypothetical protein